jgi:integrase
VLFRSNPYYSKNALGYSWKQGLKKAGIRSRVPYQSRHTYACWLLSAGAIPSFIASQMGHTDASMVYKVYSKWMCDKDRDQVELLNSKLG